MTGSRHASPDDLAALETAQPDEFASGKTGRDMDALVAACDNED